ncbi:MAG: hypothetical protein J6X40_01000 [Bacteroidales bacterium]|nr:hypothetical protein [Bacteroidales bacterium]
MKAQQLFFGLAALALCLGLFTACSNNKPKAPEAPVKLAMSAPQVAADESGLIALGQCPVTDPHLTVTVSDDYTSATICYDGKELQTIADEDGLATDDAPVHFLDANFDGLTDIFIGMGESRTYSTLLLWDPEKQQFVRTGTLGTPSLQGFMLHPYSKSVVEGGSNSFCEFAVTRSLWEGNKLQPQEDLIIIYGAENYAMNGVQHKFTLKDPEGQALYSTETVEDLPELWTAIARVYLFD